MTLLIVLIVSSPPCPRNFQILQKNSERNCKMNGLTVNKQRISPLRILYVYMFLSHGSWHGEIYDIHYNSFYEKLVSVRKYEYQLVSYC